MQIVIPMSGTGQRFIDYGYSMPKPLIEVDGKTMIEHVIDLFPSDANFIFICNHKHLDETNMEEILVRACENGKVIGVDQHKKGPVHAVSQVFSEIDDDEEVIVNYCDFSKYWSYDDFLNEIRKCNADAAISAYRGFHPHMLGGADYAFMRENENWMQEIQEKKPFTDNKMNEYASDGTYYFKKGSFVKKYFDKLIRDNISVGGEYYVSMVCDLLVKDGLSVFVYEISHMLQWGTPRDLQDYQRWSKYFSKIIKPQRNITSEKNSINLIPLAGRAKRFSDVGYKDPKPLITISGKPMIIQASGCMPDAKKYIFVCLSEHLARYPLEKEIRSVYPESKIVKLDTVSDGQACTCELGLKEEDLGSPLFIGTSDNGMLWDPDQYQGLLNDNNADCIVFSFRHDCSSERNPHMYGWIKVDDDNNIRYVSVKKPISGNPWEDHAIVGAFYFKKAKYFIDAVKKMYQKNTKINNEFYIDSCINEIIDMGLKAKVFEVDHYICWGTPDDLKVYQYWQDFFNKCNRHPYSTREDVTTA